MCELLYSEVLPSQGTYFVNENEGVNCFRVQKSAHARAHIQVFIIIFYCFDKRERDYCQ